MALNTELLVRTATATFASDGSVYTGVAPNHVSLTKTEVPAEFRANTENTVMHYNRQDTRRSRQFNLITYLKKIKNDERNKNTRGNQKMG